VLQCVAVCCSVLQCVAVLCIAEHLDKSIALWFMAAQAGGVCVCVAIANYVAVF